MKKRLIALLLAGMMVVSMLTACGGNNNDNNQNPDNGNQPSQGENNDAPPAENNDDNQNQPEENTYDGPKDYRAWTTTMATFNPHMYTNSKVFLNLGTFVDMLAAMDGSNTLEYVPHHASELPTTDDGGTTWHVKLRQDLAWDDGTPIDAHTYEYTMKMLLDPKLVNKNATYMFDTAVVKNAKAYFSGECEWEDVGVKVVNDYELEFTMEYPAAEIDFFTTIGMLIWPVKEDVYEACMNADRTSTTYGTSLETTPSCGYFILTEWITDGHDKFVRNDNDPLVKEGYYLIDSITRRYISDNATRAEMFWKGELDNHSLTGEDYLTYKNDPRAYPTLSPNVWGYFVNGASDNKIMQSKDFRNALYFGTPRERICEDVYKLYPAAPYIVSTSVLTGDVFFRETDAAKANMEKWQTNEEKAKELFDKAYEENGGTPVSIEYIYFEGQEDQKRQAEILQESFENLFGKDRFTMTLRAMPPSAAYDAYRAGDYDLGLGVRLANQFNPWATLNVWTQEYADPYETGFASDEFDDLQFRCVYGDLVNDMDGKIDALAKMEDMLLDYGCFVPVMQNDNTVMYNERIIMPSEEYLPWAGYGGFQCDIISG